MPGKISVGDLSRDTAQVEVPWNDKSAIITYRPSVFTPAMEQQLLKLAKQEEQDYAASEGSAPVVEMVAKLVVDWDLYEDDAYTIKLPHTYEALNNLPLDFVALIFRCIGEHSAGKAGISRETPLPR